MVQGFLFLFPSLSLSQSSDIIVVAILQMSKLRLSEVYWIAQARTYDWQIKS